MGLLEKPESLGPNWAVGLQESAEDRVRPFSLLPCSSCSSSPPPPPFPCRDVLVPRGCASLGAVCSPPGAAPRIPRPEPAPAPGGRAASGGGCARPVAVADAPAWRRRTRTAGREGGGGHPGAGEEGRVRR